MSLNAPGKTFLGAVTASGEDVLCPSFGFEDSNWKPAIYPNVGVPACLGSRTRTENMIDSNDEVYLDEDMNCVGIRNCYRSPSSFATESAASSRRTSDTSRNNCAFDHDVESYGDGDESSFSSLRSIKRMRLQEAGEIAFCSPICTDNAAHPPIMQHDMDIFELVQETTSTIASEQPFRMADHNNSNHSQQLHVSPHEQQQQLPPTNDRVCFGWITHPATKKWRDLIKIFSGNHRDYFHWNDNICDQVIKLLQNDGIHQFLVQRNLQGRPVPRVKFDKHKNPFGAWYPASKAEILEKTKQRFKDDRKPPHQPQEEEEEAVATAATTRNNIKRRRARPPKSISQVKSTSCSSSITNGSTPGSIGSFSATNHLSWQTINNNSNDINMTTMVFERTADAKASINSHVIQPSPSSPDIRATRQLGYPVTKMSVCFGWNNHSGTVKLCEVVKAFSDNATLYPKWTHEINALILDKLAEEDLNRFLVFLDSKGEPCVSIHDGLWYVASETEILEAIRRQFHSSRRAVFVQVPELSDQHAQGSHPPGGLNGTSSLWIQENFAHPDSPAAGRIHGNASKGQSSSSPPPPPPQLNLGGSPSSLPTGTDFSNIEFSFEPNDALTNLSQGFAQSRITADRRGGFLRTSSSNQASTHEENGWTPLHWACYKGDEAAISSLLNHQPDPNARDVSGSTPLHLAILKKNEAIVASLLKHPIIDPNAKSNGGWTPLHSACWSGHEEIVSLLLQHHANRPNERNDHGDTPLHFAVNIGHEGIVALLLQQYAVHPNDQNRNGDTPIHLAGKTGNEAIVTLLLRHHDANPNIQTKSGWTPLHYAGRYGRNAVVSLLVQHQANPNETDIRNRTPLHLASKYGHRDTVSSLLEHGANPKAKDIDGNTPLQAATNNGHKEVVSLLLLQDHHDGLAAEDEVSGDQVALVGNSIDLEDLHVSFGSESDNDVAKDMMTTMSGVDFDQWNWDVMTDSTSNVKQRKKKLCVANKMASFFRKKAK